MLRKLLYTAIIYVLSLAVANAGSLCPGSFYVAPTIVYQTMSLPGIGYNGIAPRLTLGYEDMLTPVIYTAAEIFTNPTTIKVYNNPNNMGSLRVTYSYGASILPGISFADNVTVGYIRLGVIKTRFDNLGKIRSGFQYGVGVKWGLNDLWSVRGEYSYTKYNNIVNFGHPDSNTYSIGLMYSFA